MIEKRCPMPEIARRCACFLNANRINTVPGFGSLTMETHRFDSIDRNHEACDDLETLVSHDATAGVIRFDSYKSTQSGVSCLHNTREKYNLFENKHYFFAKRSSKRHGNTFTKCYEFVKCMNRRRADFHEFRGRSWSGKYN